jgi:hypothetical protein
MRTVLQEKAAFSVAGMPGYIDFVKAGCASKPFVGPGSGMWGSSTDAKCEAFQTDGGKTSIRQFKVYGKDAIFFVHVPNAGVRINMLACKSSTPSCSVDREGGGTALKGKYVHPAFQSRVPLPAFDRYGISRPLYLYVVLLSYTVQASKANTAEVFLCMRPESGRFALHLLPLRPMLTALQLRDGAEIA